MTKREDDRLGKRVPVRASEVRPAAAGPVGKTLRSQWILPFEQSASVLSPPARACSKAPRLTTILVPETLAEGCDPTVSHGTLEGTNTSAQPPVPPPFRRMSGRDLRVTRVLLWAAAPAVVVLVGALSHVRGGGWRGGGWPAGPPPAKPAALLPSAGVVTGDAAPLPRPPVVEQGASSALEPSPRRAADALFAGRHAEARVQYEQLAAAHPGEPYGAVARWLAKQEAGGLEVGP